MIEKLERHTRVEKGLTQDIKISCPPEQPEIVSKINELVDAVNDITDWIKCTDETIVKYGIKPIPEKIAQEFKNLQDPYAEQRGWIGKLCRFWDDNLKTTKHIGILTRIDERAIVPYEADDGFWYCACEPVKPDDDIIYKGE